MRGSAASAREELARVGGFDAERGGHSRVRDASPVYVQAGKEVGVGQHGGAGPSVLANPYFSGAGAAQHSPPPNL